MATKYKQAGRVGKTVILDQLVELDGWHRDHTMPPPDEPTMNVMLVPCGVEQPRRCLVMNRYRDRWEVSRGT